MSRIKKSCAPLRSLAAIDQQHYPAIPGDRWTTGFRQSGGWAAGIRALSDRAYARSDGPGTDALGEPCPGIWTGGGISGASRRDSSAHVANDRPALRCRQHPDHDRGNAGPRPHGQLLDPGDLVGPVPDLSRCVGCMAGTTARLREADSGSRPARL